MSNVPPVPESARDELERLLDEPVSAARARAASAFDAIAGDRPIVLFGAGGLGKKIARGLAKVGRPAIAFADNNPARAGTELEGLPIFTTQDAVARFGNDAVFVVAVWRAPATERMSDRVERLRQAGAKHVTSFATLGWKHPETFLPYYAIDLPHQVLEAKHDVLSAFELFTDERSKREYVAAVRLRLHLDFAGLLEPANEPEYFPPDLFALSPDERFVDCGAFDGDTARSFLKHAPAPFSGRIAAFEPDETSFAKLSQWRGTLGAELQPRVEVVKAGVGARRERVTFTSDGGTGSAVQAGTAGANMAIDIVPLDEAVLDMRPTLVKVDTEGYEPEVLEGARRLISEQKPKLALCVYHRQDHPWRIPLLARALHDGYTWTLRSYCLDGWDLVLYAVPHRGSS